VRRAKCEVTDEGRIMNVLSSATIGRLATIGSDGYPYITPVNFVFHQGSLFFHSAREGEKLDNIARDPRVCFEVDIPLAYVEVGFNPERNPCRTHQFYHCVIIRGKARVIPDGELKTAALNALVGKNEGNSVFQPITENSSGYRRCCVVEVKPERMTAKSDLGQGSSQKEYRRLISERYEKLGLSADLETIKAMGDEAS